MRKIFFIIFMAMLISVTACNTEQKENNKSESRLEYSSQEDKESENQDDITYSYGTIDDNTIMVYGYDSDTVHTMIEIPSEIDGYTVAALEKPLFTSDDTIKKVIVPDTVTKIGDNVFSYATALEEIEFQGIIEEIGDHAIFGCSSLTNLTLKEGLKKIDVAGIANCENLKDVYLPESLEDISDRSNFTECAKNLILHAPAGGLIEDYASEMGIQFEAE